MYLILFRLLKSVSKIDIHSLQVAYISKIVGRELGFSRQRLNVLGFLHDIGLLNPVQVNQVQRTLGVENASISNWLALNSGLQENHAVIGARIVSHIEDISELSDVVEKHHYYPILLNPEIDHDIMASVVHLADSVSIQLLSGEKDFNHMETIKRAVVNSNEFLEKAKFAFEKISEKKGFWWTVVDENTLYDEFERDLEENPLSNSDLQSLGDILMYMTDVKSRFTTFHTERIAYVSKLLAERAHLGEERAMEVFFAAKIHDLGKMATPISILEKPGKLTKEETFIMQRHIFDSYLIVGGREAIEKHRLLQWGVNHHERLDSSGYAWGKSSTELDLESRIIMIADVFVALTEDRPYRKGMSIGASLDVVARQVQSGLLDEYVFTKLRDLVAEGLDFTRIESNTRRTLFFYET
jgi:putative nucleotidyltransferase with HDIG domain